MSRDGRLRAEDITAGKKSHAQKREFVPGRVLREIEFRNSPKARAVRRESAEARPSMADRFHFAPAPSDPVLDGSAADFSDRGAIEQLSLLVNYLCSARDTLTCYLLDAL